MNIRTQNEDRLVEFLRAIRFDTLHSTTVEACEGLILDHLTCGFFGASFPWTQKVREISLIDSAPTSALSTGTYIYGENTPVPARVAAMVNGTASHGFEMDDVYFPSFSHLGCTVISAAIASGIARQRSGRALIEAIVAGYEVAGRLGRAMGAEHSEHGFHSTSIVGPIGAAVACALLSPRPESISDAIGIAASFSSGTKAFQNGTGMVKRLHGGWPAQGGLYAAQLAEVGYSGADHALGGKIGLVSVMTHGTEASTEPFVDHLGSGYVVEHTYIKPFATCATIQGTIHAALAIRKQFGFDPNSSDKIVVGVSKRVMTQNSNRDPRDIMSAQYSLEYGVALALLGEIENPWSFLRVEDGSDAEIRQLMSRIVVELDAQAEADYPGVFAGRVTILSERGPSISEYGVPENPGPRLSAIGEKFLRATDGRLEVQAQRKAMDAVRDLHNDGSIAACVLPLADSVKP